MRIKSLHFSFFLILTSLSYHSKAQVTITKDNFPRPNSFIDSTMHVTNSTGIAIPTVGAKQVWDYSGLQPENLYINDFEDAMDNPDFPNALNSSAIRYDFQGFIYDGTIYEGIDEDGWYELGRSIDKATFPITPISGGPNDVLTFVKNDEIFEGRLNFVKFPMSYGNQWTQSRNEYFNFELTIGAYGLNKTPGQRKRKVSQEREVVGYGSLTIPKLDGSPTSAMDVLLLKVVETTIDSFYLAGSEAPALLLGAFGLTQGAKGGLTYYVFYKPDFGGVVLNIHLDENGQPNEAFYRFAAENSTSSVHNLALSASKAFPNPVTAGQYLSIQMEKPIHSGSINIYAVDGHLVHKIIVHDDNTNSLEITIPKSMTQGNYIYQVNDLNAQLVTTGKLYVK